MTLYPQKEQRVLAVLAGVLTVALVVLVGASAAVKVREYATVGAAPVQRTLTVSGTGTVRATPDIASVSAGVVVEAPTAAEAQEAGNRSMARLTAALTESGIPKEDVQTSNYSVYPQYDYRDGVREQRGYEAQQSLTIRIRNLDLINAVFAALSKNGATNIGSLQFSIDDPEALRAQARTEAIADARARAQEIATQLNVRLGGATSFSESGGPMPSIMYERALGMGGALDAAPDIQAGTNEVAVSVSVTYAME